MTPRTYFRLSLLAPLAAPLLAIPFGQNAVSALLALSLAFGGFQYAGLFIVLGRLQSPSSMLRLAYWSPIAFIPVQATGWLAYGMFEQWRDPELGELLPGAVYSLLVGYGYVVVVDACFGILAKLGRIQSGSPGEV